jgi:site-specific DNA recombinase
MTQNLRVQTGMTQRAREGLFNGGSMLGYTSKDKHLIIVEDEAIIVRLIFKLYLSGKGFKAIANQLNYDGYKTKRSQAFSTNSVRQIIMNPAYAGFIRYNKQVNWSEKRRNGTNEKPIIVKGSHDPLIDLDTWEKVGKLFESKSMKPTKTFTGHYPLTTLLRCPMCGQGMIGHRAERTKGTKDYIRYYQCGNFHYKGTAVCSSNLIWADYAEAYVYKKFEEASTNKSLLTDLVGTLNSKIK